MSLPVRMNITLKHAADEIDAAVAKATKRMEGKYICSSAPRSFWAQSIANEQEAVDAADAWIKVQAFLEKWL